MIKLLTFHDFCSKLSRKIQLVYLSLLIYKTHILSLLSSIPIYRISILFSQFVFRHSEPHARMKLLHYVNLQLIMNPKNFQNFEARKIQISSTSACKKFRFFSIKGAIGLIIQISGCIAKFSQLKKIKNGVEFFFF